MASSKQEPTETPASEPSGGPNVNSTSELAQPNVLSEETASGEGTGSASGGRRRRRGLVPSRISAVATAVMVGAALFMGGVTLGAHIATTPGTPADQETRFGPFWDTYTLIQKEYAGSPKPSQDLLVQGAIKGMLEVLNDPWSYYQPPADFQSSLLNVGGQAEGIGVQVQLQPVDPASTISCAKIGGGCELAVLRPITGSPADIAGVKAGDVFVTVDGKSLDGLTTDQTTALIKGPKGTPVTLGLDRNGTSIKLTIVRNVFDVPQVTAKSYANGKVAYISVSGVNDPAFAQFDASLRNALEAGQKYLILDLRGNLGGFVGDAGKMASEFISSGPIYWQVDAAGSTTETDATPGGRATDGSVKLIVLVDGNTASAAEILAAALKERGVATLVGTKTYGKGVAQEWLPLSNNFGGIHLTIARWLTPNKTWIQGKGITPDTVVSGDGARAGTDPVLDAALVQFGFAPETGPTSSPSPSTNPGPSTSPAPVPSAS